MRNFLENQIYLEDMEAIYLSRNGWSEFNNSSVYISGASGMIASYICMFLIYLNEKHGFNISIYAGVRNLKKAEKKFGEYINKNYFKLITSDVNQGISDEIDVDYIIHAASLASPQFYGKMPVETVLPNIIGTYKLLEYSKQKNVKSFLFFSSGAVYGTIDNCDSIREEMAGEFDYLQTGNFYGESKRCGEMMTRAFWLEYGVPAKSIRIHHSYGPTMDIENDSRVFSEFVGNIINGQNIVMKSKGTAKRAFCYMSDAVSAMYKVLLDGTNGESYNMGNDVEFITISDLAERLVSLFPEKELIVEFKDRIDDGYVASNSVKTVTVDLTKIRSIGWEPKVSVDEGFYRTVKAIEIEGLISVAVDLFCHKNDALNCH